MNTTRISFGLLCCALAACEQTAVAPHAIEGQLTVTGAADGTLAGRLVTLYASSGASQSATSDATGHYRFADVTPGRYVAQATLPSTLESSRAVTIDVTAATVTAPSLDFIGLGSVFGRVRANGSPLASAQLFSGGQTNGTSDGNGDFELTAIPAGAQLVVATAPGYRAAVSAPLEVTWQGRSDAGQLDLTFGATTQILAGRVSWPGPEPQAVPPIQVSVDDGKWLTVADAAGNFSVPGVPDGVHSLDFYELTQPKSGEPLPLHNRLPQVFVSSGVAFAIGSTIAPLPTIPLYRGHRIGDAGVATWSSDGKWALIGGSTWRIVGRDGSTHDLGRASTCELVTSGVLCERRLAWSATLAIIDFTPFTGATIVLSERAVYRKILPQRERVLIGEPSSTAPMQTYRVVDWSGVSIALDAETGNAPFVATSATGHRVAIGEIYKLTYLFDALTGAKLGQDGCYTPVFGNERLFCAMGTNLIEVVGNGTNPVVATSSMTLYGASPDGAFLYGWRGGWSEGTARVVRVSDGALVFERLGDGRFTWSADGKKAWVFLSHWLALDPHPEDNELVEIDLVGATARQVAPVNWCFADVGAPSIWICDDENELFAIDASTNLRRALGSPQASSSNAMLVAGALVVHHGTSSAVGTLDYLTIPGLERTTITTDATLAPYASGALPSYADALGRRIAYLFDGGGSLVVHDRTTQQKQWIGPRINNLSDLAFLDGGDVLASMRGAPLPMLSDLAGLYLTEFAP